MSWIDISEQSGLPLEVNLETLELRSKSSDLVLPQPAVRTRKEIEKVLKNPEVIDQLPEVLYLMYRNVHLQKHSHVREKYGLRYDISVFSGCMFGEEFFKTAGHYHPYMRLTYPLTWPELYEVLYGECIYLLQKVDDAYRDPFYVRVEDVIAMLASPGEKAVMPPNYGHVTIAANPAPNGFFVMSNWVCDHFKSHYESVEASRGFAYYRVFRNGQPVWEKNLTYKQPIPPLREARPCDVPEIGLQAGKPMYHVGAENPEKYHWLVRPDLYLREIWAALQLQG
ncbi:MAG: glucose-6-phosphate isomerase [Armatimonadetes bacterium]|nr:glucose-6-phosphate isomerase [Armatimonadota bacterium]